MAVVKCPTNILTISLVDSGHLTPDANHNIICTAAEATALCKFSFKPMIHSTDASGNTKGYFPGLFNYLSQFTTTGGTIILGGDDVTSTYAPAGRLTIITNQGFILVEG